MNILDVSVPEIYKSSADFRFFLDWFAECLSQTQYNGENILDCYDPLRCKSELLWMLADTMGYKYDDRLPTAFNRFVLLYFMSIIRNRGSKDGVTLAAEVNLKQFQLLELGKQSEILYNRLEDTSIPVNSVNVTPHIEDGYIDVVYFSEEVPVDSCVEYARPVGMYLFSSAGVRVDAKSKICVDARLTDSNNLKTSIGPTHVGHYSRKDYASLQKMFDENSHTVNTEHTRSPAYKSNADVEESGTVDAGYRTLYSLQLCNNTEIVKSLLTDPIFSLGYGPQDVHTVYAEGYLRKKDNPEYNLRLDRTQEKLMGDDVYVNDADRTSSAISPRPAVNPVMSAMGDAIALDESNTKYTKVDEEGNITVTEYSDS